MNRSKRASERQIIVPLRIGSAAKTPTPSIGLAAMKVLTCSNAVLRTLLVKLATGDGERHHLALRRAAAARLRSGVLLGLLVDRSRLGRRLAGVVRHGLRDHGRL